MTTANMTANVFAPLRDRIIEGHAVTVDDVRALADVDAYVVLDQLQAEAAKILAERERAGRRKKAIAAQLAAFEQEADRLIDRIEAAGTAFDGALAELEDCWKLFDEVRRTHLDQLHRLGWNVGTSDVLSATGGRVIIERDQLQKVVVDNRRTGKRTTLLDATAYTKWARMMQAERDGN